jgi:hypothetical protein
LGQVKLLIHADPGGRCGLLAAWLSDQLDKVYFDVGANIKENFKKIHNLEDPREITKFDGITIRIAPSLNMIDLHTLLYLRKNWHVQMPQFTRDEYSLETFSKLWCIADCWFNHDATVDNQLYDHVMKFDDMFDISKLINLYKKIHNRLPTDQQIEILEKNIKLNLLDIDLNHSASIVKLIRNKEQYLNLKEENRQWSIVDVYQNTDTKNLYQTVDPLIKKENYGK